MNDNNTTKANHNKKSNKLVLKGRRVNDFDHSDRHPMEMFDRMVNSQTAINRLNLDNLLNLSMDKKFLLITKLLRNTGIVITSIDSSIEILAMKDVILDNGDKIVDNHAARLELLTFLQRGNVRKSKIDVSVNPSDGDEVRNVQTINQIEDEE